MFRGVRPGPLPTAHMTTEAWMKLPVRGLWISDIYATQPNIMVEALLGPEHPPSMYCEDPYPHVVILPDGDMYLEDGHHRTIRIGLTGRKVVAARVLDLQDPQ